MKESKVILLSLGIGVALLGVITLLFMGKSTTTATFPMPWMSEVKNNKVIALGMTLEESPISSLMSVLGSEAEVALFKNKTKQTNTLEVYFSSAKIGGLSARVIITLDATTEVLEFLDKHISEYEVLPSGNEKVLFHAYAANEILTLPIKNLSIIPYSSLDKESLTQLFGAPSISTTEYWLYPNKGLKLLFSNNAVILEFSNSYLDY